MRQGVNNKLSSVGLISVKSNLPIITVCSYAEHCLSYSISVCLFLSIHPSVCPSQSCIVSKQMKVGQSGLQQQVGLAR